MITEASFIPITPKKIPENFFSLIEKLSDTSKYLIYRVDVIDFNNTKVLTELTGIIKSNESSLEKMKQRILKNLPK